MKKISLILSFVFTFLLFDLQSVEAEEYKKYFVYYESSEQIDIQLIEQTGAKVVHQFESLPALLVEFEEERIGLLEEIIGVLYVEEDPSFSLHKHGQPDGQTASSSQQIPWGISKINAMKAWSNGYTGKGVKIAVIDSGISLYHEDLDVHGGISFVPYTQSYDDDHGHGTHVAGIISAKQNDLGVVGVAPDAELYAVKVINNENVFWTSDLVKGIEWSINNEMDVINLSLCTCNYVDNYAMKQAILKAYEADIVIVGSTGNTGQDGLIDTVNYPGKYPEVIAVASIDRYNEKASSSSFGEETDVAAPGVAIYSTTLNGNYGYMSGTSMAAPHVSGVMALLKQKYPLYTNRKLRQELLNLTVDLGNKGWDPYFGEGLVQLNEWPEATVNPTHILLNQYSAIMREGEQIQLQATVYPGEATNKQVTWFSSDPSIATVDNGLITAKQVGTTIVGARTVNGHEVTATITVQDEQVVFEKWEDKLDVDPMKEWLISFSLPLDVRTISEKNIYVTDSNGEIIPMLYIVDRDSDSTKLMVVPVKEYVRGQSYTLWIKDIKSKTGKLLKKNISMLFKIKN